MTVTLYYGRDSITKELASGSTVSALATNANLAAIGAPTENNRFTLDGQEVGLQYVLQDGDEIYVETRAHSKA